MERIPMTAEGHAALQAELKNLKSVERPNIIAAISEARAHGDLSENAEYDAARDKQGFIEGRIAELEAAISLAEVIDTSAMAGDTVRFGAWVVLADEDTGKEVTYRIVGQHEADLEKGKISVTSPLARALIGKSAEDAVEVAAPGGSKAYEICEIRYK
jgi:transcription elongation factor GreA